MSQVSKGTPKNLEHSIPFSTGMWEEEYIRL